MRAFKRLTVETHFNIVTSQQVKVSWALAEDFLAKGPYVFTIQRALAAEGDWEDISQVTDQPWGYDKHPLSVNLSMPVFYRVRLVDGTGVEYLSQAVSSKTIWNRYDWSLAKEITRKEFLLLRKRTGVKGYLLKRRVWGDYCAVCTDPVTQVINDSHCQTCYGTGYTGGYYTPFEYWISFENGTKKEAASDQGMQIEVKEQARGLAYPDLEVGDIWVSALTNERYTVSDAKAVARIRGVEVVSTLVLSRLPTTHVIYDVPVPC